MCSARIDKSAKVDQKLTPVTARQKYDSVKRGQLAKLIIIHGKIHTCRGSGAGGGGQLPPNFLSQWDGYACAPLNFGNH